jgi:2-polyprenyl-3-methyl-5-hydroxy-6-metoxy-1,4-benzoquinol methylase
MDQVTSQNEHWSAHYTRQHALIDEIGVTKSLDYSNEAVQLQTYAHSLEALGRVDGLSIMDAGCGWGCFTLLLHALGARAVGVDFVQGTIDTLRRLHSQITWEAADITDAEQVKRIGHFDRVVALEVLQYSGFERTVAALWNCVKPGGRLIGCVPNDRCPIATKVKARYGGLWAPVSPEDVPALADLLPDVGAVYVKGLTFAERQEFLPLVASPWEDSVLGTPNRMIFAVVRE